MFKNSFKNIQKKSLKERFLLVIGIMILLAYLVLGLIFIFWKTLPIEMQPEYRIALGIVLIVYSFIRFFRVINLNDE